MPEPHLQCRVPNVKRGKTMNDDRILSLLYERDERAIAELQQKYHSYCTFIARSILENDEDAEECVNQTYFGVWNSVPPNKPEDLRVYVSAVCRKTALKQIEKRLAEKRGGGRAEECFEELDAVLSNSDDGVDGIALRDALERFLRTLSRKARIVFVQKYWYFMTVEEIAKDRGMTVDSVKSSLYRSREKLKRFLKKEGFEI